MSNPVGEKIRALREQRSLTQEDLADLAGVTQGKISHCETGERRVSLRMIIKIAHALGVGVDEFLPSMLQAELDREAV